MSDYYAKVIADSISPREDRLTTIECRYPHIIGQQVLKHRAFSISATSSRAIGSKGFIDQVREDPFIPEKWGKTQRGMVAKEELEFEASLEAEAVWREACEAVCDYATYLAQLKVHKEITNRLLETFSWQTIAMSGTDYAWENLLELRVHSDAQPQFQTLALLIKDALAESEPKLVDYGENHLPYITEAEREKNDPMTLQRISVGRVAKTSYGNQNKFDIEKDLQIESQLFTSTPRHSVPFEAVACPTVDAVPGNFKGWLQLRHNKDWQMQRTKELEATKTSD